MAHVERLLDGVDAERHLAIPLALHRLGRGASVDRAIDHGVIELTVATCAVSRHITIVST